MLRDLEAEKYWYFPATYSEEKKQNEINQMMMDGHHYYQLKTDGHLATFIHDIDNEEMLLGRGISKVTGERTRYEDNVFFFTDVAKSFSKPTYLIGEVWLQGGVDKQVGSIIRSKPIKAKSIQDIDFYEEAQKTTKFTAKDRRDIENNTFFNQKLMWRIFDCWYYDGEDLMNTPWITRQKYVQLAAEKINNPLVTSVAYEKMDENFLDNFTKILAAGEEGVVCYLDSGVPAPGQRKAHKTCKLKRDVGTDLDVFIYDLVPATRAYNGKQINNWEYWQNTRTGEFVKGKYFKEYQSGGTYEPVTKNFFYSYPGAISVGVYDKNHNIVPLCNVAGLTEDMKISLRDNFDTWHLTPLTIGGMALSDSNGLSVRHPYLKSVREDSLTAEDCTLEKIL